MVDEKDERGSLLEYVAKLEREALEQRAHRVQLDHELANARQAAELAKFALEHARQELESTREVLAMIRAEVRNRERAAMPKEPQCTCAWGTTGWHAPACPIVRR